MRGGFAVGHATVSAGRPGAVAAVGCGTESAASSGRASALIADDTTRVHVPHHAQGRLEKATLQFNTSLVEHTS